MVNVTAEHMVELNMDDLLPVARVQTPPPAPEEGDAHKDTTCSANFKTGGKLVKNRGCLQGLCFWFGVICCGKFPK